MTQLIALVASLAGVASALPHHAVRRQVSELRDSYDFVIAGGGTAGLTVADRLTGAFPDKTVLVVEYGEIEYAPGTFDPPLTVWGGAGAAASRWAFSSLPNLEVDNKRGVVFAGQVVGGSSAVNGMFFDRPSRSDFEAWDQVNSPEYASSEDKWDWDGIFPYFQKSVTFTEPNAETVAEHGYTWDLSVYGGETPIYSSFPPFLWADHPVGRAAWSEMGIRTLTECAGGDKEGLCWIPISEHPETSRRSHSGLGHYAAVNETRTNYDLLVKHQVIRVVYPEDTTGSGPPLVEVRSRNDDRVFNVTANAEVILSAGTFHTPTILQRSGIGPASVLDEAEIPLVLDLPGVGSNFQDHCGPDLAWNYTEPLDLYPLPSDMSSDPDFAAEAAAQFDEIPARGPYTLAMSNSAIFVSLPNITADYEAIVSRIRDIVSNGTASSYLPPDHRDDPRMIAGYEHQLSVLADFFENPEAPSLESAFATGTSARAISLHALSRGTVRLNLTNPLEQPLLDYRSGSNPIDFDVHIAHLRYLRQMVTTPTMQQYGAVEVRPGADVQSDEDLLQHTKDSFTFSFMHPCCTAAMLPEEKGGVVGPDLRVHGLDGLRIADISVLPLLPSSHLSALAYAIGEKAADIIIREWSEDE
ncbi:related to alcohol oxidase [Cephalotrichum gorgonifer]|uniref:Related to alcohol oxidase n=1 Tax=Cephalotrichum gorgonifer TaxID=2041049 RepID=A0AAE8MR21_9PEZI|nr:related to alcohol oxidase [Cephalotrichum gorgonifer]